MVRRSLRSALVGSAIVAAATVPSTASAQSLYFQSCATAGVCGYVEALFVGSLMTVRVANLDNSLGSALFMAQVIFVDALAPGNLGTSFPASASASTVGAGAIGNTPADSWGFNALGGSNILDLASFGSTYIEGTAASPFRAAPGDLDFGTWVTANHDQFVDFSGNLAGIPGATGGQIAQLGFCTNEGCVSGAAAVVTPEPATLTLLATGFAGLAAARRRRRNTV